MRASVAILALLVAGCGDRGTRVDVTVENGTLEAVTLAAVKSLLVGVSGAEPYSTIYDLDDQLTTGGARWVYLAGVDAGELVFTVDGRDSSGTAISSGTSLPVSLKKGEGVEARIELGPPVLRMDDGGLPGDARIPDDLGSDDGGSIIVGGFDGGDLGPIDFAYPTFLPAVLFPVPGETLTGTPVGVAIDQIDGTGLKDVAFVQGATSASQIVVARQTSKYVFNKIQVTIPSLGDLRALSLFDMDRDGKLDVGVVDATQSKFLYVKSLKGYADYASFTTPGNPTALVLTDFNLDGYGDVALVDPGSSTFAAYTGPGYPQVSPPPAVGTGPLAIAVGDLDLDGHPDLAIADGDGSLVILLWSGTNFAAAAPVNLGASLTGVAIARLDADLYPDLVVTESDGQVHILINHITTVGLTASFVQSSGTGTRSPVIGDLDGDGKNDLAVINSTSRTVSMFRGDGMGSFGPEIHIDVTVPPIAPLAATPNGLAIGDLDGDLRMDLAVATSAGVYLYLTNP